MRLPCTVFSLAFNAVVIPSGTAGKQPSWNRYSDLRDAISIEKRYFTSDFSNRP